MVDIIWLLKKGRNRQSNKDCEPL